jgi:predicted NUDIX family NTP pyrophosphohydrolase
LRFFGSSGWFLLGKKGHEGSWSIPKGELEENEDPLAAAMREFEEETGFAVAGRPIPLGPLR